MCKGPRSMAATGDWHVCAKVGKSGSHCWSARWCERRGRCWCRGGSHCGLAGGISAAELRALCGELSSRTVVARRSSFFAHDFKMGVHSAVSPCWANDTSIRAVMAIIAAGANLARRRLRDRDEVPSWASQASAKSETCTITQSSTAFLPQVRLPYLG